MLNHWMRVGRVRSLLILVLLLSALWILFAKLVVPSLIESAYHGQSWSFANRMIGGQAAHPVHHYLQVWDSLSNRVSTVYFLSGFAFLLLVLMFTHPMALRRIVGRATPGSLGAIRMWTCTILLITTLVEDLGSIAWLPTELRHSRGLLGYLYPLPLGLDTLVTSEISLSAFQALTELLLFCGLIGWRTRVVLPLAALCHFVLLGILIDYSFFWHQNLVALYVLIVLCFTPCADGWSVDRLRKIAEGTPVPDSSRASLIYGWSRYACWVVIALPYVAAGLGKLREGGLYWWHATNLRTNLYMDTLNPREFNWALSLHLVHVPDVFLSLLGVFALCSEALFGFVLFSRRARRILPIAAIMMHIGIFLLQRVLFIDLILLQLLFFDFTRLRKTVAVWVASKHGPVQILYDGVCPLCRRTVRLLRAFDLVNRLECLDFRQLDLSEYNRRQGLNLTPPDLEVEMHVIIRRRPYRGFDGYRRVALALPVAWPLAPWLFLPGISSLGTMVYGHVARHRLTLFSCDSHCPGEPAATDEAAQEGSRTRVVTRGFGFAVAVSGIILAASLLWFYRIEFYPFTSWVYLYSASSTSGTVEYQKVFAQRESGVRSRARLEETIGALALDARYSRFLARCFQDRPEDVAICRTFLHAAAVAYNRRAKPGDRVTQYEIQMWTWDFRAQPFDPQYGHVTRRFVFDLDPSKVPRQHELDAHSGFDRPATEAPSTTGRARVAR
jgi:predicted DCC family thiol-disulfide oxidoreductase YuxK